MLQAPLKIPRLRRDPSGRELRMFAGHPELRATSADGSMPFAGHAAVFNARSVVLSDWWDTFQEIIEPGAFAGVLDHDVRLLINHDSGLVLARTVAGNLRLSEDAVGLLAEADIVPTTYAADLALNMRAGNITQMSFAFEVDPDGERWELDANGVLLRTVSRFLELYDVSVVTYPAYQETDAAMRAVLRARAAREHRTGARNSAVDAAILRTAVDALREQADELESLLTDEEAEPETDSVRTRVPRRNTTPARTDNQLSIGRDQERHHQRFAARYGLKI